MIRRILIALDLDSDTTIATHYALEVARRFSVRLTGVAVVDMGSIEDSSKGGGIGSMYYAEQLREKLTTEAREKARMLTESFSKMVEEAGVEHVEIVEEGVPFQRIVEEMKYHDLLIIGNDPHFFYSHPKQHTHTIANVVQKTIGPTLVVSNTYREVKHVLIANDGTNESARAVRQFIHLEPLGKDLDITIINVYQSESTESELILKMSKSFLEEYGFTAEVLSVADSDPKTCILQHAQSFEADLIVMGAHTKKTLTSHKLGAATSHLLGHSEIPLFIDH
ncbi:MAG: universal stress protein [Rhodothermia bacterium]|nr:MAG: universal stress protein [Rhodothermia bacterium]